MSATVPTISTAEPTLPPTTSAAPPTTMSSPPTTAPPTTPAPPTISSPPPVVETSVPPTSPPSSPPPSSPPPSTIPPSSPPPSTSSAPESTPIVTSLAPTSTTVPSPSASTPLPSPTPTPSPSPTPSVTLLPTPSTSLSSLIPSTTIPTTIPTITTASRSTGTPTLAPVLSDTALVTELSTAVFTLTSAGRLVTITSIITAVVPAASARNAAGADGRLNSPTAAEGAGKTGFFSNTGAVAGTFVVLGLIVAVGLVALARFFARRKRARRLDEDVRVAAGGAGDGGAGVNRFGDDEDGGNPFADEDSSAGHHQGYPTSPNMAQYAPLALSSTPGHRMSGVYVEGAAYQRPRSLGPVVGGAYEGYRDEQPLRSREYSGGSAEVGGYATDSPRHSGSGDGAHNTPFGRQPTPPIPYQQQAMLNRRDSGDSYYGDLSRRNTSTAPAPRGSDERLDPNLGMRAQNHSVASLDDERDYSRVLRVMNARGD